MSHYVYLMLSKSAGTREVTETMVIKTWPPFFQFPLGHFQNILYIVLEFTIYCLQYLSTILWFFFWSSLAFVIHHLLKLSSFETFFCTHHWPHLLIYHLFIIVRSPPPLSEELVSVFLEGMPVSPSVFWTVLACLLAALCAGRPLLHAARPVQRQR